MPTPKDSITVYLEPELHEALKAWAEDEQRSKSFLAAVVIEQAVKAWQAERAKRKD